MLNISMSKKFVPTWLYVKVHNKTGLKYLGKTIQDPYKYSGSGVHWAAHIKKHGNDVTTTWAYLYTDPTLLEQEALFFSKVLDVVSSTDWANKIIEDGATGGKTYIRTKDHNLKMSQKTKGKRMPSGFSEKVRQAKLGVKRPEGFGATMSKALTGRPMPEGFGKKISTALTGKTKTEAHRLHLSESIKNIPKIACVHCGHLASPGNIKRWHNNNCKRKEQE